MTQSESPRQNLHAPLADFRRITRRLGDLPAGEQTLLLELELFRALTRAAAAEDRTQDLEQKLDEDWSAMDALAGQVRELASAGRELGSVKSAYEQELRILQEAYAGVKQQCRALEESCRSLLLTIERAAFTGEADDLPPLKRASR
jgi:chromosome segregation ATPase